jgi:hypothetical protein
MSTHKHFIRIFVLALFLLTFLHNADAFYLPDTGQTLCYSPRGKGRIIDCPVPGGKYAQDGTYTINPPSYTVNPDGTVFDNNTWLMWQQQDDNITRTWDEARGYCESLTLSGYADWRLPTKAELASIVIYGGSIPSIDSSVFLNTKSGDYWSSTTYPACYSNLAWYVHFGSGIDFWDWCDNRRSPTTLQGGNVNLASMSSKLYARCVRGGPLVFGKFQDHGNGTVTDLSTGLMWQQGEGGSMKWGYALNYCEKLTLGGYADWRLPNARELETLVDDSRTYPSINTAFFPNVQVGDCAFYWTSTTNPSDTDHALTVAFVGGYSGYTTGHLKRDRDNHVRCVRGAGPLWLDDQEAKVEPSALDFLYMKTGESKSLTLTISNIGRDDLAIGTIMRPSAPFSVTFDECSGKTLSALLSCSITVTFNPIEGGTFTDILAIPSNDADHPSMTINISGSAIDITQINTSLLPDTGQTTCYNDLGQVVTCPSPENPLAQDGSYLMNPPSFTINTDGSATDNNTNLMWQREDDNITRTWYEALNYCENLTLGGYTDWRLPTRHELFSIVDFGRYAPSINLSNFPITKTDSYWTSSSNQYYPDDAWYVFFGKYRTTTCCVGGYCGDWDNYEGVRASYSSKSSSYYVRCVRGKEFSSGAFLDNGDDTITDLATGLMWQQGSSGSMRWTGALAYCEGLTLGGYSDWRLPNIKELESLSKEGVTSVFFPKAPCDSIDPFYWSSTSIKDINCGLFWAQTLAYIANPLGGWAGYGSKSANYMARCVRGGNTVLDPWEIKVEPAVLNYGSVETGKSLSLSFTVSNVGTGNLMIGTITNPPSPFSISSDGCSDQTLLASASCSVTVKFEPTMEGNFTGLLTIPSNDADYPSVTVSLSGISTAPSTSLTGLVTDSSTGQPLSNVSITVIDPLKTHSAVTGSNGTYTISGLAEGTFTATFSKSGYFDQTVTGILADGQTLPLNIQLSPIPPPTITNIAVNNITTDSAIISWTTDQDSDSLVEYGETIAYGNTDSDLTLTTTHTITLSGLNPNTTYHFRVISKNADGLSSASGDNTFSTKIFSAKTIGDYGNITVMEVTGNYDAKNPDGSINTLPRQEIAKEFFKSHPDEYDFLVIFSNFDFLMPEAEAKAFYLGVKNDTLGIGKEIFDNSALFGSNGKLQGTIDMGNALRIVTDPGEPGFEETLSTLSHEMAHRWAAHVKFRDASGNLSTALLGKDDSHWSFLLDSDGSVLYGNDWQDNKDGTFTSLGANRYYSPLDLYLMGFYDKSQVPPMLLIDNPSIDPTKLPEAGVTISGAVRYITIDDIIAAEGLRVPDSSTSQRTFKVGFVLITTPGTFTGSEPTKIENIRNAWAGRFATLTGSKGSIADVAPSITIAVSSPSNGDTISKPEVTVKGAVINTTGNETGVTVNGIPATVYGNQFIASHVPLTEGQNTITVTATDTVGTTATTSITVNAVTTGNYITLSSNIESGISPLEVTLRIDGSFSVDNSNLSVTGPTAVEVLENPSPDEYRIRMTVEGIYYFTVSSTGPDGIVYQDTIAITVLSKTELDKLLKAKWEGMKAMLIASDAQGAAGYFISKNRDRYASVFSILQNSLPSIANDMQPIENIYIEEGVAQYRIKRIEDVTEFSYYIYFVRDADGIWRIRQF